MSAVNSSAIVDQNPAANIANPNPSTIKAIEGSQQSSQFGIMRRRIKDKAHRKVETISKINNNNY